MKAKYALLGMVILATLILAQPTITVTPKIIAPGGTVTISITGTGEERCAIEVTDPTGAKAYVREITLSAGKGSVTWNLPLTARIGSYTVYVACTESGTATETFRVTAVVGGETRRDFTPLLLTVLAGVIALTASTIIVKKNIL